MLAQTRISIFSTNSCFSLSAIFFYFFFYKSSDLFSDCHVSTSVRYYIVTRCNYRVIKIVNGITYSNNCVVWNCASYCDATEQSRQVAPPFENVSDSLVGFKSIRSLLARSQPMRHSQVPPGFILWFRLSLHMLNPVIHIPCNFQWASTVDNVRRFIITKERKKKIISNIN